LHKSFLVFAMTCLAIGANLRAEEEVEVATAPAGEAIPVSDFESTDRDADGQISREEFRNRMTKVFLELDVDGDGVLQAEEFSQVLAAPHDELADNDGSETLSQREFMDHTAALFEAVDSNNDGHLTRQELAEAGHEEKNR
jgi:Ca2+-binding EF-hand superfamily protein